MSLAALETSSLPSSRRLHLHQLVNYSGIRLFGRGKFPISQKDYIVHETTIIDYLGTRTLDGTGSLSLKKNFRVQDVTPDRLLRYSTIGWDMLPIYQKEIIIHDTTPRPRDVN